MEDNNINKTTGENNEDNSQSSRFSRRRFLQSGVAASPLLLSVKSPMAWGCGTSTNGSITTYVSGNASAIGSCTTADCQPPEQWKKIFKAYEHDSLYAIRKALEYSNIYHSSSFSSLFLANSFNWQNCSNANWKYKLVKNKCSSNTFYGSLAGNEQTKLIVRVQNKYNRNQRYEADICNDDFHKNVTCGFLNSVLTPDVIRSDYYPTDIKNAVTQSIHMIATTLGNNRSSNVPYSTPLKNLTSNLALMWHR
ncbi:hypothetical protein R3X26_00705 [Vibrio sp. TH_r3]|uniref:hypothetical protein n=1 Tax=Vibrio sp. TH_r3 TaxID=3082084 RepID=UPI002953704C|nr:hypothetical protein [Vibrio sp. TH_r3]MDV7102922.1 hypothetical protein [Vibrio sp. TH_r3]